MYGFDDPSFCLTQDPPPKSVYKENIRTKIIAFHENEQRQSAKNSKCLKYFNTELHGLTGRCHPAIQNVMTSEDVKKMRPHIKFLTGNYLTSKILFEQSGKGSPLCNWCLSGQEQDYCHILTSCHIFECERNTFLSNLSLLCEQTQNNLSLTNFLTDKEILTQLVLDPTSLNLSERVHMEDPILPAFFKLSRNYCFVINKHILTLSEKT